MKLLSTAVDQSTDCCYQFYSLMGQRSQVTHHSRTTSTERARERETCSSWTRDTHWLRGERERETLTEGRERERERERERHWLRGERESERERETLTEGRERVQWACPLQFHLKPPCSDRRFLQCSQSIMLKLQQNESRHAEFVFPLQGVFRASHMHHVTLHHHHPQAFYLFFSCFVFSVMDFGKCASWTHFVWKQRKMIHSLFHTDFILLTVWRVLTAWLLFWRRMLAMKKTCKWRREVGMSSGF